jgi:hypothetical protein
VSEINGFELGKADAISSSGPPPQRRYGLVPSGSDDTYVEYPADGLAVVRIGAFGVRGIGADGSVVWESGPVEILR